MFEFPIGRQAVAWSTWLVVRECICGGGRVLWIANRQILAMPLYNVAGGPLLPYRMVQFKWSLKFIIGGTHHI